LKSAKAAAMNVFASSDNGVVMRAICARHRTSAGVEAGATGGMAMLISTGVSTSRGRGGVPDVQSRNRKFKFWIARDPRQPPLKLPMGSAT